MEFFENFKVMNVLLHMSVITQHGYTSLMLAAEESKTEVVSLLLAAGANIDLQNEVVFCFDLYFL